MNLRKLLCKIGLHSYYDKGRISRSSSSSMEMDYEGKYRKQQCSYCGKKRLYKMTSKFGKPTHRRVTNRDEISEVWPECES